jgi:hypothetical protein
MTINVIIDYPVASVDKVITQRDVTYYSREERET